MVTRMCIEAYPVKEGYILLWIPFPKPLHVPLNFIHAGIPISEGSTMLKFPMHTH